MKELTFQVDDLDYDAIQAAIAKRQTFRYSDTGAAALPDGEGPLAGRLLAEVAREWSDYKDRVTPPITGENP